MPQHLSCQEDYEDHDESVAIEIPSIATNIGLSAHPDEEPAPEFRSHRGRTIRLPVSYRRSLDDHVWPRPSTFFGFALKLCFMLHFLGGSYYCFIISPSYDFKICLITATSR